MYFYFLLLHSPYTPHLPTSFTVSQYVRPSAKGEGKEELMPQTKHKD